MSSIRTVPAFMIAAGVLLALMIPGAIALFGMKHDTVVYITLAQCGVYGLFAWLLLRARTRLSAADSRRYLFYLLIMGSIARAALLFAPPHSTDIYRYVWDGRVQADGINPYSYVPADPALAHLRDHGIYLNVNRKDYAPTIYPPAAQLVYFVATRLSETVTMMKAVMLGFEAAAVWAIIRLLAARGLPIILASLCFLHPLAIWEVAGSGHVDIIAVAFTLLSLLAAEKGNRIASGVLLGTAALTKYFPLTLAPAIYRRWDWRMPAAFAVTVVAIYLPYISAGSKVFGFLGGYAGEEFRDGEGIFLAALLKHIGLGAAALPLFLSVALLTLLALAWRTGFRADPDRPDLGGAFAIATAFTVFVSPHYCWYFLWLVPFLCFFPRPSVFWLTLSSTALYLGNWPLGIADMSILYVPFAVLLVAENLRLNTSKEQPDGRAIA
ncbi:MAG: glycosyltransferase family 87 protein [Rhodomicrobium sp.]